MPVSNLCSKRAVEVLKTEPVQQAAKLMLEESVGCLVVMDNDSHQARVVGIVTDRDIAINAAKGLSPYQVKVSDIMSTDLVSINKSAGINDALELMGEKHVRRLLVTRDDGSACGIVSTDDLVQLIGEELNRIGRLFQDQIFKNVSLAKNSAA